MILNGSELTGITGERGNWLCQPGVPYDARERHVRDDDLGCLLYRHLPICMGDEGPEALEVIEYSTAGDQLYSEPL